MSLKLDRNHPTGLATPMAMAADEFLVNLDCYRGPVELLMYLVRRCEVEIKQLPIHQIAEQYLTHLDTSEQIDINLVGDFLEIASLLCEAKMRSVLPRIEDEDAENDEDPRTALVQRLLLYKEFKDVAVLLEEQARQWQTRLPRHAEDLPPRPVDIARQPIHEVELWDLVSSFGRVLRESKAVEATSIVYDETPVHVYMQRIHQRLADEKHCRFSALFEPGMHKSAMIGIFLAILELVRHHHVETEQIEGEGDIRVIRGKQFDRDMKITESDSE